LLLWTTYKLQIARDLLNDCQSLERVKQGAGRVIDIPRTKEALICWGYMKAMQDLSDEAFVSELTQNWTALLNDQKPVLIGFPIQSYSFEFS
jgi:hypothetical protein